MFRLRNALAVLTVVPALLASQAAPAPAHVVSRLRAAVRIADRPDTGFTMAERMRLWHVPGVSIAIIDNNRVVYAQGFGVTEFGATTAVDTSTLFLAGSISKPVFTTGALSLVEQGKLSLDTDINTTLTSWKLPESRFTATEKVTLRRLLTHSAGLTVWGFPGYDISKPVPTVPQLLDGVPPANTPAVRNDTTPGARWLYSGGGMTIAQLMATDVTGEKFPALMKRLVLTKAGMTHSTYENPLPQPRWREAASGHETMDTPVSGRFHVYPEMAAAGLWTTASDLARWEIALAKSVRGDGGGILSPAMARQMVSKQMHQQPPYGTGWWGLGVSVSGDADSLAFSHGGRDEGFVAQMEMWPARGRGIAILMNGVNGPLINEIMRAFREEYALPPLPRVERRVFSLPDSALQTIVGQYEATMGGVTRTLSVVVVRGVLVARDTVQKRDIRLLPQSEEQLFDTDAGTLWRVERERGLVKALVVGTGANAVRAVRR